MYVMRDNFESFTYNLKAYFEELGRHVQVVRSDKIANETIEKINPEGIIVSPGPKRPEDAIASVEAVKSFRGKLPILGVCLGHQVIGYAENMVMSF